MKQHGLTGGRQNRALPRTAGLAIGFACLGLGLSNAGKPASSDTPRGITGGPSTPTALDGYSSSASSPSMTQAAGSTTPTGGVRRNIPADFSLIFGAAAAPSEATSAGLMVDTNADGVIDAGDVEQFVEAIDAALDQAARNGFGGYSARYDFNDDGRLDEADLNLFFDALGYGDSGPRFRPGHLEKC